MSTSAFAQQQSATGGATVRITNPNCTIATCFVASGANSLLYSDASTPIDIAPLSRLNSTTGLSASSGGTVRLGDGGSITGTTAMLADGGTIESSGPLTLKQNQPAASLFVNATNGGSITLAGPTTIQGPYLSNVLVAQGAGSTITVSGAFNAALANTTYFAIAQNGGHVALTNGGTIQLDGTTQRLSILTADGQQAASTVDATGLDAATVSDRMSAFGAHTVDAGTINIKNSTFNIGGVADGTSAGILVEDGLNQDRGGIVNLDNSHFTMTSANNPVVQVQGTKGSQINLTNGSSLTAFGGSTGALMKVSPGRGTTPGVGADVTLHATDSTLVGQVTVDAPGAVGVNHLALIADGTTTWTGDLDVATGSAASSTIGGSAQWTGTTAGTSGIDVAVQDAGTWNVTGQPSGLDNLSFNGGTVRAGVNNLALASPITVNAGGGTVDTQRYAMAMSGALSGTGTLTKAGSGTLTQTGNSGGFGGGTAVNAGTLMVNGTLGGTVNVASGAALGGTGTVGGDTSVAAGGTLLGRQGQVLNFGGNLTLVSGSNVNVSLGIPESTGLFNVRGNLTLDGRVNVTDLGGFSPGIYRLFDYTGSLTNNGIDVGTVPTGIDAAAITVQTAPGQVNLVNTTGVDLDFWDGGNSANHNNNVVDGGSGTWNASNTNWTESDGALNGRWTNGHFAVFMGQPGTVTVEGNGAVSIAGMQFAVDGYRVEGGAINLERPETIIRTGAGGPGSANVTATIASELTGTGGLVKSDFGTLTLTGNNTYQGGTVIREGTLQIGDGGTSGSIAGGVLNSGSLVFNRSDALTMDGLIQGSGTLTQAGTGTTVLTAANTYTGDTLVKGGTLAVNGSIASPTTIAPAGTLAGNGTIFGNVDNFGTIAPGNGSMGTLTIAGNYTGHGGVYQVTSALGDSASPSDRLVISGGTAGGNTNVKVVNAGGAGARTTGFGIPVVTVANGGTTANSAFALAAPVAAGPYEYQLYRGSDFGATGPDSNNWYLSSSTPPSDNSQPLYRPEAPVFSAAPGVARELSMSLLGTYHERVGDSGLAGDGADGDGAAATGSSKGAWGRWIGEERKRGYGGELNARTQSNITGLQVGTDLYKRGGTAPGQPEDRFGGFFTYGQTNSTVHGFALGQQNYDSGNIGIDSYSLGATWTRLGASGWYLDGVVMGTRYNGTLESHRGSSAPIDGYGLTTSLEAGYPIALAPNLTLEPQAQLIWQYSDLDSTKDDYSSVNFSSGSAFAARAGARLSSSFQIGRTLVKPSLTTNIWQQFNPKDKTDFSGTTLSTGGQDTTALEVAGGLSAQISKRVGIWSSVSYLTGIAGPNQSAWRGNVGVRITW
ncbi:autotransporter outer membrane beta-barrel domain-containing protein [Bordetella sp. H567]|uniref:autotransporter outer membrane beta-barrel domain-containing protein n=1 Tax=Bordetella sp. H567 TaxID=1697043 RepID=UPI00131454C0|nr:autotransporter outer membrane beta-barrel domain-containing protein [Bordetella sp. H567]